jgi:hypothetical protein
VRTFEDFHEISKTREDQLVQMTENLEADRIKAEKAKQFEIDNLKTELNHIIFTERQQNADL